MSIDRFDAIADKLLFGEVPTDVHREYSDIYWYTERVRGLIVHHSGTQVPVRVLGQTGFHMFQDMVAYDILQDLPRLQYEQDLIILLPSIHHVDEDWFPDKHRLFYIDGGYNDFFVKKITGYTSVATGPTVVMRVWTTRERN